MQTLELLIIIAIALVILAFIAIEINKNVYFAKKIISEKGNQLRKEIWRMGCHNVKRNS